MFLTYVRYASLMSDSSMPLAQIRFPSPMPDASTIQHSQQPSAARSPSGRCASSEACACLFWPVLVNDRNELRQLTMRVPHRSFNDLTMHVPNCSSNGADKGRKSSSQDRDGYETGMSLRRRLAELDLEMNALAQTPAPPPVSSKKSDEGKEPARDPLEARAWRMAAASFSPPK